MLNRTILANLDRGHILSFGSTLRYLFRVSTTHVHYIELSHASVKKQLSLPSLTIEKEETDVFIKQFNEQHGVFFAFMFNEWTQFENEYFLRVFTVNDEGNSFIPMGFMDTRISILGKFQLATDAILRGEGSVVGSIGRKSVISFSSRTNIDFEVDDFVDIRLTHTPNTLLLRAPKLRSYRGDVQYYKP